MSARQNKKRKNRNNVNNRERTVTTFTEDPNTSFLVPQPSEEPALSSPFSVASTSATSNSNNNNNNSFQNFGMSYSFHPHGPNNQPQQQGQQQQQQQFFSPQVILPPGKSDLEVLENLKSIIKEGQHEFYRAIPQPAALASLYLGPTSSQVLPHPEQHSADYYNQSGYDNSSDDQIPPYPSDSARRPTDPPVVKKSSSTANNPDPTPPPGGPKPGKKVETSPLKPERKMSTGPDNADVNPRDGALSGDHRDSSKNDTPRPLGDRPDETPFVIPRWTTEGSD
ncbi:hypothetical protein BDR04DRAFT_226229 [Suillus decipiens]|nr:hypothetical protein BDR04DRAFT_226229 [Suillus decipiens]